MGVQLERSLAKKQKFTMQIEHDVDELIENDSDFELSDIDMDAIEADVDLEIIYTDD